MPLLLPILLGALQSADADLVTHISAFGGSGHEELRCVAVDSLGHVIVAGHTDSRDLTITPGAWQPQYGGGTFDVYLAKLDAEGTLLWSTYFGGKHTERAFDVNLGPDDSIYLVGGTASDDFPVLGGPFLTRSDNFDGYVARFSPEGRLLHAGFLGGTDFDSIRGAAVDADGTHHVVGRSQTEDGSFPVLGPLGPIHNGGRGDSFYARIDRDGRLLLCGFLGGDDLDYARNVALAPDGSAYICGWTNSTEASFPVQGGPDLSYNGGEVDQGSGHLQYGDGYVVRVSPDGTAFTHGTYVGGAGPDAVFGVAVGDDGRIHLAGHTGSDEQSLPVTRGPGLVAPGASHTAVYADSWVGALSADFSHFDYLGYYAGDEGERIWKLTLAPDGTVIVNGSTRSPADSFPHHRTTARLRIGEVQSSFVGVVDPDRAEIIGSTVLGGRRDDLFREAAVGPDGSIVAVGWTDSSDYPFEQDRLGSPRGDRDGVIAHLAGWREWVAAGTTGVLTHGRAQALLRVNGSTGFGPDRVVHVGDARQAEVALASTGHPDGAPFVLFAWVRGWETGAWNPVTLPATGARVGSAFLPYPQSRWESGVGRFTIMDSLGLPQWFGQAMLPAPESAPVTFPLPLDGRDVVLQALIADADAPSGWSLSNAVRVQVR